MTSRRNFIKNLVVGGTAATIAPHLLFGPSLQGAVRFPYWVPTRADGPWELVMPGILSSIKPPVFPKRDFLVTKYGARGNGQSDCAEGFKKAIAACNKAGGGRVVVPSGTFLTGAIHLKSNVNLVISRGATIKFNQNPNDYLPVVFSRWEGVELWNYSPFIYAFEQTNIAITGEGTLDGQSYAGHWWSWNGRPSYGWKEGMPNQRPDRTALLQMACEL